MVRQSVKQAEISKLPVKHVSEVISVESCLKYHGNPRFPHCYGLQSIFLGFKPSFSIVLGSKGS